MYYASTNFLRGLGTGSSWTQIAAFGSVPNDAQDSADFVQARVSVASSQKEFFVSELCRWKRVQGRPEHFLDVLVLSGGRRDVYKCNRLHLLTPNKRRALHAIAITILGALSLDPSLFMLSLDDDI